MPPTLAHCRKHASGMTKSQLSSAVSWGMAKSTGPVDLDAARARRAAGKLRRKTTAPLPGGADLEGKSATAPILEMLKLRRIRARRVNAGTFAGRGGYVAGAPAGTPDIAGELTEWVWGARRAFAFEIETKVRGGRLSEKQIEHRDKAEAAGVLWGVATSAQEGSNLIDRWRAELAAARIEFDGELERASRRRDP